MSIYRLCASKTQLSNGLEVSRTFESQRLVSVGYAWLAGQMGALLAEKRFANADEKGALRMIFDLLPMSFSWLNGSSGVSAPTDATPIPSTPLTI